MRWTSLLAPCFTKKRASHVVEEFLARTSVLPSMPAKGLLYLAMIEIYHELFALKPATLRCAVFDDQPTRNRRAAAKSAAGPGVRKVSPIA